MKYDIIVTVIADDLMTAIANLTETLKGERDWVEPEFTVNTGGTVHDEGGE